MAAELQGLLLSDSFVLGWKRTANSLEFTVDFSLWPESPYYHPPKEGEWTCYRRGILCFDGVTTVEGLKNEADVRFSTDANGERDFGNIDSFEERDGFVNLSGDFGEVLVHCSSWRLQLQE